MRSIDCRLVGSLTCDVVVLDTLLAGFREVLCVFDLADRDALMISLMVDRLDSQHGVSPNH